MSGFSLNPKPCRFRIHLGDGEGFWLCEVAGVSTGFTVADQVWGLAVGICRVYSFCVV